MSIIRVETSTKGSYGPMQPKDKSVGQCF